MSDLFVKAWPEGCAQKETDTHWRAKKGKASWNYRLIYDVELGHNTRAMKFPYLYIQVGRPFPLPCPALPSLCYCYCFHYSITNPSPSNVLTPNI